MLSHDRPAWPWLDEADGRILNTSVRDRMLDDAWEDDLAAFLEVIWGPRKIAAIGQVDFSWNALRVLAEQLSTPGLYGVRPVLHGPEGSEGLVGPGGLLDACAWSATMQDVEYRTRGLGDMLVRVEVLEQPTRIALRPVRPWAVHVEVDPRDPQRAVKLWELSQMRGADGTRWVWEVFSLEGEPAWHIEDARAKDPQGAPLLVTNRYHPDIPAEGWRGEAYPWRYQDGRPFLPYVHYQSRRGAGFWSWSRLRGLHRGAFHAARLMNTALYGADCAAQKAIVALNCYPMGADLRNAGANGASKTIEVLPGTVIPFEGIADQQALVLEVGPGADIMALWSVARSMMLSMLAAHGLRESDVVRAEGNPTSAAALVISDSSRREAQRQLAQLFALADQELIAQVAAMARLAGLGSYPETGYLVEYQMIARSAQELQAERDEQDFELSKGLLSRVQLYMARRGVDRETAIRELRAVAADEAALNVSPVNT